MIKFILYFSQLALYFVIKQNIGCASETKMIKFILYFSQLALYLLKFNVFEMKKKIYSIICGILLLCPGIITAQSQTDNNTVSTAVAETNEAYLQLKKLVNEQGYTKEVATAAQSLLKNATKSGSSQLRIAALEIVFATQADKIKTLKAALKDIDVEYRNAAFKYASDYADKAMYTDLMKSLSRAGNEQKVEILYWIGNEAKSKEKREILKTVETAIEKTGVQTLIQFLSDPDYNVKQASASALGVIGENEAISALADLFRSEDAKITSLAKSTLSSYDGDVSLFVARIMRQASDEGKKAALELLSQRKADAYFNAVLEQTKSVSPQVKIAAFEALKNVVSEKDFIVLCGMLETAEPIYVLPLQQAVTASISSLAPEKRKEMINNRMLQAGDSKNYLYHPILTSTD